MNATLVTLALGLALGQTGGHAEPPAAPAAEAHQAEEAQPAAPGAEATPPGEHGEAAGAEGHAAGHHEPASEEEHDLGTIMMHHVADGYVIEHPGICGGEFRWECKLDLKEIFDDSLVFHVGGVRVDMTPTKHVVMMWIGSLLLVVVVLAAVRRRSLVPRGLYNFIEMLVQFVRNEIAVTNIGEKDADRFVPYLVSAFFFILFLNLLGLVPFAATATANLAVTMMMALFTFIITQYAQIKAQGIGGYLKHLTGGVAWWLWWVMVPVEIVGLFAKPFALTVRLFANMLAGHFVILALLGLIYALNSQWVALGSVPMALGIFMLELFVAFVQAYIFAMLSALFIGAGLVHHDDHGAGHGHEEPGQAGSGEGPEHASHASHVAGTSPGHG